MTTPASNREVRSNVQSVPAIRPVTAVKRWLRPLARLARRLVGSRSPRKSGGTISRETWDDQYQKGSWARLHDLGEVPHNSVIVGLLHRLKPNTTVLDVGCGEGVLFAALRPYGYARYLGIDLSAVAIARTAGLADSRTVFAVADAETYSPPAPFDVIIFNESLYYFRDPLATLRHYARHLASGGIVIVSIYHQSDQMRKLVSDAQAQMSVVADVTVGTQGAVWSVFALAAGQPVAHASS